MASQNVEKQLQEIHEKLDFITTYMHEQQRKQREMQELKDDLVHIGKDAFQAAVVQLEEVTPYFDTDDLIFLLKKLIRNTRNLTSMMQQIESTVDFVRDAKEPVRMAFGQLLETLDVLDRKGYFDFMRESVKIVDEIVTSFTVDDVRLLRENISEILLTIKSMTQPEMLATVDNALGFFGKMAITVDKDVSYKEIIKQLRQPEVKRGLIFMLEFVKNMAVPNGIAENNKSS
jgi:uncharacterized protein YjgD (DUF1641 family)